MVSAKVTLRPCRMDDAYALWLWANDAATRTAAFDRGEIGWREHVDWLERQLASGNAFVSMGFLVDGRPIGSVRFDTEDSWRTARLSYVVAPEARRQGYGRSLVEEGMFALRAQHADASVRALVRADNEASQRIFRALGWNETRTDDGRDHLFSISGRR
jgi:ribosomal protein S18 acetylase RimI-like enzyme